MKPYPFLPIIVGTDINAYNMAISFHEEYNIQPVLVGRGHLPFTTYSKIPKAIEYYDALGESDQFANILIEVAKKYKQPGVKLVLVGTNDLYVRLIIENTEALKPHFVFNYTSEELMNDLQYKANFYKLCEEHGIDTPTTYFYSCAEEEPFSEEMLYPVIIKPSNGIEYNNNKFKGQQKVYKVNSLDELNEVITLIKGSGYRDELIIQDYIPGDDTFMWDAVLYVNSRKQTELVAYAQVVLQEHTVTAIGNYTALIARYNEPLMKKLQNFLEAVGYNGFANFDLKYDERDGKYKVFEVNIRQGRSSYYVTGMGHNMARYLVDDLVYEKKKDVTYVKGEFLFTVVPKIV
ncbi:MAG: ATP-grasp domain-containing protein, partial [Lysinibacillus sp.]